MICKNCQNEFEGNFCNHCGQKASVRRLDLKYLVQDVPNSVFQLNRGFFFTVKEILTKPGHAIRNFIEGKRQAYYKPIAFLIVVSTIYILINYFMGVNSLVEDVLTGIEIGARAEEDESNLFFTKWLPKYQIYVPFFVLPLFSIASYLAFRKSDYNYVEHFVLNVYITAQQFIIYSAFAFVISDDGPLVLLQFIIGIGFVFWTYIQFFSNKKLSRKVGLVVLTYMFFILFSIVLIFLVGLVYRVLQ